MAKCCRVVCDTATGLRQCVLTLPDDATVAAALQAASALLGAQLVEWNTCGTGIYGRVCKREHVPLDGDRIEVYRALLIDPRNARRQRAAGSRPRPR